MRRRDFLASSGAAALAATAPPIMAMAVQPAAAAPAPPMLAWAFDVRYGEYRDTVVAATADDAHARMIAEHFDCDLNANCPRRTRTSQDDCVHEDCCCSEVGMSDVERVPNLDAAAARGEITLTDYQSAGWGMVCIRAGCEPMGGDWEVVDGEAVCNECMTIEEWRAVNPEHAAELIEDARVDALTDEEYEREFGVRA
jgi:hypothetical protein